MEIISLVIVLNAAGFIVLYFLLHRQIVKYAKPESASDAVAAEIQSLIIEFTATTDRNIALLEDRVLSLQSALSEADKRLTLLQRNNERQEQVQKQYSDIGRKKIALPPLSREDVNAVSDDEAPVVTESALTGQVQSIPKAASPSRATGEEVLREETRPLSGREAILDLYYKGFSSQLIASRLNCTIAEVELVISLRERNS